MHQFTFAQVRTGIEVEKRRIAGRAPALVFLHEGLGSAQLWRDVPDRIAAATGCEALIYSRYGNGFSPVLDEPRNAAYMHDEAFMLGTLLEEQNIDDAILIGHSDGASIALIHAGQRDKRLRACVLLAPHVFVEDHSLRGIRKAREAYESAGLRDRLSRHHADVDATFYGWNDIWLSPAFYEWNLRSSVRNVRVPLLVIQGAEDAYGTFAQVQAILDDAPASVDALYLSRCGHSPQRDRPETVLPAIADFIAGTLR